MYASASVNDCTCDATFSDYDRLQPCPKHSNLYNPYGPHGVEAPNYPLKNTPVPKTLAAANEDAAFDRGFKAGVESALALMGKK